MPSCTHLFGLFHHQMGFVCDRDAEQTLTGNTGSQQSVLMSYNYWAGCRGGLGTKRLGPKGDQTWKGGPIPVLSLATAGVDLWTKVWLVSPAH